MENIPKYVFDKEYSTQWKREVQFLADKDINYTYAKKHPKYPVIRYKYTKTPELFLALAEFYHQVRSESFFKSAGETSKKIMPLEKGYIEIDAKDLSAGEKKLMGIEEEDVINVIKDDTE